MQTFTTKVLEDHPPYPYIDGEHGSWTLIMHCGKTKGIIILKKQDQPFTRQPVILKRNVAPQLVVCFSCLVG